MSNDAAALIRSGKLPERIIPVCLHADLAAEFEDLERQRARAVREATDSLAGGKAVELAQRMEAIRREMEAHTIAFRLRALPRPAFASLKREHPPRKDMERESGLMGLGVNEDTFFEPLLRASIVEPELDDDVFRLLVDERLTDAQYEQLTTACWVLNTRTVDVPFSLAASLLTQTSSDE